MSCRITLLKIEVFSPIFTSHISRARITVFEYISIRFNNQTKNPIVRSLRIKMRFAPTSAESNSFCFKTSNNDCRITYRPIFIFGYATLITRILLHIMEISYFPPRSFFKFLSTSYILSFCHLN